MSRNRASTSLWRPNALTMACPVNASSTWALSAPVWPHWATKRVFDRAAMARIVSTEMGIDTMATSDSSGEIQIIMATTPTSVSAWDTSWLSVCCRLMAMLSMSLVTRLSRSPRCWRST